MDIYLYMCICICNYNYIILYIFSSVPVLHAEVASTQTSVTSVTSDLDSKCKIYTCVRARTCTPFCTHHLTHCIFICYYICFHLLLLYVVGQKQQKILQECTLIKMYVKSIDNRLKRLEDGRIRNNNNSYEEVQIIQNKLPLKTIDEITQFDQSLDDENVKKTFVCPSNNVYFNC